MAERVHPAVIIEIPVEAAPRVVLSCSTEGEESRVWDWIAAHEELADIVRRALELAQEARAA